MFMFKAFKQTSFNQNQKISGVSCKGCVMLSSNPLKQLQVQDAGKNALKIKEYEVKNPLVALVAISNYELFDPTLHNLPGVEKDIQKCVEVFNEYLGYDMHIMSNQDNNDNQSCYKITNSELDSFFCDEIRPLAANHDALICILWYVSLFCLIIIDCFYLCM